MKRRQFIRNTTLAGGILAVNPANLPAAILQQPAY
jgi:hypothetical protein